MVKCNKYPNPYEALKALTRPNEAITEQTIHQFITELEVPEKVKHELWAITPYNYTGVTYQPIVGEIEE